MSALAIGIKQKLLYPRYMNKIAQAIRNNNFPEYQAARYPTIQDGEEVLFHNEDFSGVDFDAFSMGFFKFENCNLDNTISICGQPIYFTNCSLRGADLRGARAIIYAENCDFTGLKYDDETLFAYDDLTVSEFTNCLFDTKAREYLETQGVRFTTKI